MCEQLRVRHEWLHKHRISLWPRNLDLGVRNSTPCGPSLFDRFEGYRLGDMLYSRFFRHSRGGADFHCLKYPGSFASLYLTRYHQEVLKGQMSAAQALAHIILTTRRATPPSRWPPRAAGVAAVHLRLGDVLELSPDSDEAVQCFGGGAHVSWAGEARNRSYAVIGRRPYVMPRAYFEFVAGELAARQVHTVVLVAASGFNMSAVAPDYPRSCKLLNSTAALFERKGLRVAYRVGLSPDADLAFFTTVDTFVASGGQFSALAADVAALHNVSVLEVRANLSSGMWLLHRHRMPSWKAVRQTEPCVTASAYMVAPHLLRSHDAHHHDTTRTA